NRILSTEQEFTITANVQWNNAVEIFARMILPTGYFAEDKTQRLTPDGSGQQDVNWTITAPVNATPAVFINIELTGKDKSNQTSDLTPDADSLAFTVVQKAQLVFDAQIAGPENALDRVLTVGQEFTVGADLSNAGTAGVSGDDSVTIQLTTNYSTNDDLTQLISAGGSVIWTIKAPDNPTGIEVITIEIPAGKHQSRDENSKDISPLTPNPARVTIPVQTQAVGLNVTLVNNIKPTTIVRGDTDVRIFGLAFENTSDADIDLELVSLTVKDGSSNEIAPNSVLTKLTAAELDGSTVYGTVSSVPASNKVDLVFSPALRIVSSQMASVEFRVDIATQTAESGFSLSIETPQQDIRARDTGSGEFVVIRDSLGFAMDTPQTAGISVLIDSGLEDSFFNYPNPFGSSARPNTAFNYHLVQDSEVSLRIYTLVGQLVWEVSFAANSLEGLAGTHSGEIKWDGRNGENRSVLNGVYVAVLTTNAGQAITKIAIAK
ncbi:MAG: hypothetical protein O7G31_03805, partial [Calditrichaeota bacterium]|nr:hypothetical protein [Calditrichota bacterium]